MIQVYRIDENGYYVEPIIVGAKEEIPNDCIENPPTQGLYRARWIGREWVEDMTQEEIDELYKQPIKEPSEIDLLKQEKEILAQSVYDLTTIVELILTGGITE